jgi:hypothetical protein
MAMASTSLTADAVDATSIIPNAQPGECYAKVLIPATFETTTEKVLSKEASETLQIIPAKFGPAEEKILVQEASSRLSVVPGTFKNESEKVLVRDEEIHWKTSLKGNIALSPEILAAAKAGGADVDGMAVGTCYREYFTPAKYTTQTESYIARAASEKLKIVPATYTYEEQKILVKEASQRLVKVPATYENVSEKVLVEPEKTMWKKSECNGRNNECGVMCLVTTPARYKTVTKRVVKTPPTTKVIDIPAQYKTIKVKRLATPASVQRIPIPEIAKSYTKRVKVSDPTFTWEKVGNGTPGTYTGHQVCKTATPAQYKTIVRTVVDVPPSTKEVEIPAVYKTVRVSKLVQPAQVKRTTIPEDYRTITKRNMVTPSQVVWKKVVCKANMGTSTVRQVQTALKNAGYYTGPIDGIIGRLTTDAIKKYQKAKNLPIGGLTYQVIESLGLSI